MNSKFMTIIDFLEEKDEERLAFYMEAEVMAYGIQAVSADTIEPINDLTVWEKTSVDTTKLEGYE
jgi:hypothetical protein